MQSNKIVFDYWIIDSIAAKELEAITKEARERIKERTPVKTWKLLKNIKVWNTTKTSFWYSKEVYTDLTDVEYAWIVEYWVKWKEYNYNTWKGVKRSVWAKMYEEVYYIYQIILWTI